MRRAAAVLSLWAVSVSADTIELSSTGFDYLGDLRPNFLTTGLGADDPIGDFTLPIPAGVFPGFGDPGPWVTSFVSLRFTVFDGDTATPEEIDFDHLFPTFGIPGTEDTLHLPMALNGFGNQRLDTVTNTLELSGDPVLGGELTRFLARSDGSLRFFIRDIDEGGNRLNFLDAPEEDFDLIFRLDRPASVPEPGVLACLGVGLIGAGWIRSRRSRK